MTAALARLVSVTALCFACASADVSGGSSSEPAEPQASSVAPTSTEPISVAKLCEHVWALVSAESAGEAPVAGFESYLEECVAGGEEERRSIGEAEFQQQAACALAAASVAELLACDPDPDPPPSPREPASFPDGALVRPLTEVVDHAIYSPDPDSAELQQTKAARFDKADGMSTVAFCVETNGSTAHIHTVQKFPGDPKVDEIIRDTVAGWRFKPFIVDGAIVEVCTEKSFRLRFK
jgi:hypothetical protein